MFLDLHELNDGALIDSDLCIIGAGAAGITIALELLDTGLNVLLVESGGLEFEEETQALYTAESIGLPYGPLDANRLRYFGGTTNHWGGMSGPFQKIDLEKRDWVEHSGWPISREELDPFYPRAYEICQLEPYNYGLSDLEDDKRKFLKLLPEKLEHKVWRFSPPTKFGKIYRSRLQSSEKIKILLHANATEIVTDWTMSNVTSIQLATLDGHKATVRSKLYVLACGGIENARVLLISNNVDAGGVGNRHDAVGRFFMEHPHIESGTILLAKPGNWATAYEQFKWKAGASSGNPHSGTWVGLGPSAKAQRRSKILNSSATLDIIRPDGQAAGGPRIVLEPDNLEAHIANVIRDPDENWQDNAPRSAENVPRSEAALRLYARAEQAPNPDSRVKLTDERDALGLNRVALDWRMTELDKHTIRVVTRLIGEEIGRLGLGRLRLNEWLLDDSNTPPWRGWPWLAGGQHHMGTTRIGQDPKTSVVDSTCRVHDISNLYVAGSSVFTTSGYVNPTLNIVALAVRLTDHLKRQFT